MGETPAERNKETMGTIKEELDNAPSLAQYDYKAWDEDTRAFVNNVLRMYLNPGDDIAAVTSAPKAAPAPEAKKETPKATATAPAAAPATENKVTTDDDLDSFLDDLNI